MQWSSLACAFAILGVAAGEARADCPTAQAACLLDEEGVALLADKKYADAAEKFEASVTAGPSARAELGYALALQGAGRLGLAYDAILEADRLSAWEVRGAPNDAEVHARAERIKYVLGDLRSQIGAVHVQLPPGIPPDQLLAVQREGRDVRDPKAAIAVAPGDKLVAVMRNGARYEGTAPVAAGGDAVWVVPLDGQVAAATAPIPASGVTSAAVVLPPPLPLPQPATGSRARLGVDLALLPTGDDNGNTAVGPVVHVTRERGRSLSLSLRAAYLPHLAYTETGTAGSATVTGSELAAWLGASVVLRRPFYLAFDVGYDHLSETAVVQPLTGAPTSLSNSLDYLVYTVALGVHAGRIDARIGFEGPLAGIGESAGGTEPDLPVRLMLSFGADLFSW